MSLHDVALKVLENLPKPVSQATALEAVTSALKEQGFAKEAKQFADWFSKNGKALVARYA